MLPFSKIWSYCLCAIAPVLALFYANRFSPNQRPIFLAANGLCYFVYLLPYALFGAEVSIREDGLTIRQYGVARIPFADVRHSWCIFLAPFRVIVGDYQLSISAQGADHLRRGAGTARRFLRWPAHSRMARTLQERRRHGRLAISSNAGSFMGYAAWFPAATPP
jgi:hypothetical protein